MASRTSSKDIEYQNLLAQAVKLRVEKTPYEEIIKTLGHWNSVQACQKAVVGYLKKTQFKNAEDSRAEAIALLEDQIFELRAKFKRSKSIMISGEIRKLLRELCLLQGSYAPTKIAETDTHGNDKPKIVFYLPDNSRDNSTP